MPDVFRVAPKHININGFNVPEPLREWPEDHCFVYAVSPTAIYQCQAWYVRCTRGDALRQGLVHRTEEAARLHREALLSFTTTEK